MSEAIAAREADRLRTRAARVAAREALDYRASLSEAEERGELVDSDDWASADDGAADALRELVDALENETPL